MSCTTWCKVSIDLLLPVWSHTRFFFWKLSRKGMLNCTVRRSLFQFFSSDCTFFSCMVAADMQPQNSFQMYSFWIVLKRPDTLFLLGLIGSNLIVSTSVHISTHQFECQLGPACHESLYLTPKPQVCPVLWWKTGRPFRSPVFLHFVSILQNNASSYHLKHLMWWTPFVVKCLMPCVLRISAVGHGSGLGHLPSDRGNDEGPWQDLRNYLFGHVGQAQMNMESWEVLGWWGLGRRNTW